MNDTVIKKLWDELLYAHDRTIKGPTSDRRTMEAYRNGLLAAVAIVTGEPETHVRQRLMESEANR